MSTLPVELTFFKIDESSSSDNNIKLIWQTASEINNDVFEIEKSYNAEDFTWISSIKGKGNFEGITNYSFIDEDPFVGVNYYRLRQIDFDGTESYSEVVKWEAKSKDIKATLYPNPVIETAKVSFESKTADIYSIKVYNTNGLIVYQATYLGTIGTNEFSFDVISFEKGYYIVNISDESKSKHQLQFYKGE